jgi:glycosyltransferase involved in cell wall biosynthesis
LKNPIKEHIMRILIDLQGAQSGSRYRGIGRYSSALAKAIIRNRGDHDVFILLNRLLGDINDYIIEEFSSILPADRIAVFSAPSPVAGLISENSWRRGTAELIREWMINDVEPDVLLITSLFEGAMDDSITSIRRIESSTKTVVVLYNLLPFLNPEEYLDNQEAFQWYFSKIDSLRGADLLLTISESTRLEAIDMLCFDANQIVTIYAAADERFRPAIISSEGGCAFLNRMGIQKRFIMYIGEIEQRMNFEGLIRAFGLLPRSVRESHQLVLVTTHDSDSQNALCCVANAAGLKQDELVLLGYVSDDELVMLYSLCALCVFPSFHNGLGLPVFEAMCCGAAVIGPNAASIPEVIGIEDALFDPRSDHNIAELILRVLTDEMFRESLKTHAIEQSKRFSWDRSAKHVLRAMEEMTASSHSQPGNKDISALLDKIATIKSDISPNWKDLKSISKSISENERSASRLDIALMADETKRIALETSLCFSIIGHINGSYSLAAVNRRTALALEAAKSGTVRVEQIEGKPVHDLSCVPAEEHAAIVTLAARERPDEGLEIAIAQHWPVWVPPYPAGLKLASVAWEESLLPVAMVRLLNEKFQGILVWTHFVAKALIDSGVRLPIRVMGYAPDLSPLINIGEKRAAMPATRQPSKAEPLTFLHVSSCFPRKGVDVLLAAYGKAFRRSDPVRLIIKGFPNPHNNVPEQIACLRSRDPEAPEIIMINRDIPATELAALYAAADVVVLPTRGEGFNIPAAEALAAGVPLIVTGYSGQIDFAGLDVARHIDFCFASSGSHLHSPGSVWADPDVDDLAAAMREIFAAAGDTVAECDIVARVERGRRVAASLGNGAAWASRVREIAVELLLQGPQIKPTAPKIAWVTTWDIPCGIATYSRYLLEHYPDAEHDVVVLCDERTSSESLKMPGQPEARIAWRLLDPTTDGRLAHEIEAIGARAVIIQHQPGLIGAESLLRLLHDDRLKGREIILTLHNLRDLVEWENWDFLWESLQRVSRILVHNIQDLNLLKTWGLINNVTLFPHGTLRPTIVSRSARDLPKTAAPIIGTYGFFMPNKGFDILIKAIAKVRDEWPGTALRMVTAEYPSEESYAEIERCQALAQSLGMQDAIEWYTDYLSDAESLALLSYCDLLALPRRRGRPESASGSVRVAMASRVPVLVTSAEIFGDLGDAVLRSEGTGPRPLAAAIAAALCNRRLRQETVDKADRWLEAHNWALMSERLYGMICGLITNRNALQRRTVSDTDIGFTENPVKTDTTLRLAEGEVVGGTQVEALPRTAAIL